MYSKVIFTFRLQLGDFYGHHNSKSVELNRNKIIVTLVEGTSEIPSGMRKARGRAGTAASLVDGLHHQPSSTADAALRETSGGEVSCYTK